MVVASKWGTEGSCLCGAQKLQHPFLQAAKLFPPDPPLLSDMLEMQSWTWNLLMCPSYELLRSSSDSTHQQKSCWSTGEWRNAWPSWRKKSCNNIAFSSVLSSPNIQNSAHITQVFLRSITTILEALYPCAGLCSAKRSLKSLLRTTCKVLQPPKLHKSLSEKIWRLFFETCDFLNGKFVRFSFFLTYFARFGAGGKVLFLSRWFFSAALEVTELKAESHHMPLSLETLIKPQLLHNSQGNLERDLWLHEAFSWILNCYFCCQL